MWAAVGAAESQVLLSASSAISSTRSTTRRRSAAFGIRVNAFTKFSPSLLERKSVTYSGEAPSARPSGPGRTFEEERDRHLQDNRYLLQSARADPVGAFLVLLDLLEGEAERVPELFLTHAQHHPAHTDPAADMLIDRVGHLLGHTALLGNFPREAQLHAREARKQRGSGWGSNIQPRRVAASGQWYHITGACCGCEPCAPCG